jgi:benzodiazapine receptor
LLALAGFVGLCLLAGLSNAAVTAGGIRGWYDALAQPPGTPPNWLFGPVWTVLYVLLGVAAWLVWRRVDVGVDRKRAALRSWGWALAANALWSPAFFGLHRPDLSLLVIALMLGTAAVALRRFRRLQLAGAALLLPYLAWTIYAAYLNAGVWWLNRA